MKKILHILIIISVIPSAAGYAQPTYTANPPSFTAEDEITLIVDVTGTSLSGYSGDVWIWAWISEGCASDCDAPSNVNPAGGAETEGALMTRSESSSDVYSITFVPSVFFGKAPSEIKKFGFKLKSVDWSDGKQSDNDVVLNVEPLIFTPKVNRIFPTKVTKDDVVTLYLDQSVAEDPAVKYETGDFSVTIRAYDETGNEVGAIENKDAINERSDLRYVRILPTYSFGSSDVASIRYSFKSKRDGNVQTEEFEIVFFK